MNSIEKSWKITNPKDFWNQLQIVGVTASQSWLIFQCAQKCENFIKNPNCKTDLMTSYMTNPYVFGFIWKEGLFIMNKWKSFFRYLFSFYTWNFFKKNTKIGIFFNFDGK